MHLKAKSIRETEKNPENSLVWAKKPKKTHWAGFFLKKPGFFQPWFWCRVYIHIRIKIRLSNLTLTRILYLLWSKKEI